MTEEYNKALSEQLEQNMWQRATAKMTPTKYTEFAADVAGIFDPTPISDTVGATLAVARGDYIGAGLSILGYIPYVGDLGKIAKVGRYAPRTAEALSTLLRKSDELADMGRRGLQEFFDLGQVAAARKRAAERVREAMLRCRNNPNSRVCRKVGQLQMPRTGGKWKDKDGNPIDQPADGNGVWEFDEPKTFKNADGTEVTVNSVEYKNGFPDFSNHTYNGKHDIWDVSGNASTDARRLAREHPELNIPDDISDDYVLHHFDNGQVGYVPRAIHDRGTGAAHSGGNSILNNDLF